VWLPDDAAALRSNAAYSIRFANEGTWESSAGANVLTTTLRIDPVASGPIDTTSVPFVPDAGA
jgi:hypothetical protein